MKILFKGIFNIDGLTHDQVKQYIIFLENNYKKALVAFASHGYNSEVRKLAEEYTSDVENHSQLNTNIICVDTK